MTARDVIWAVLLKQPRNALCSHTTDAILAALAAAGLAVVPREPTSQMREEGYDSMLNEDEGMPLDIWRAMVAAALDG